MYNYMHSARPKKSSGLKCVQDVTNIILLLYMSIDKKAVLYIII